jgi:hypothetical protein
MYSSHSSLCRIRFGRSNHAFFPLPDPRRELLLRPNTSTGLSFYRGLTCRLREGYKRKQGIKLKPHNVYKKIWKLDLFPEISKEVATEQEERLKQIQGYEENSKKHPYEMFPKPEHQPIIPRFPTENERAEALRQVEETFRTFNRGDVWVVDTKYAEMICAVEFIKISHLTENEK